MNSSMIKSGKAQLAVTSWGTDGTSIVALHPGVGDSRIWGWCAPSWAEAGQRVVAYDRRGFGETLYVEEPHDDLIDLLAVTSATHATPAVIVGNSMGGGLALDLALEHPEHVDGLVLVAPSPSGYPYDTWETAAAEAEQDNLIQSADEAGDVEFVNRLEVRYWLDGVDQPEGRVDGPARDLMIKMNGEALRAGPIGEATERAHTWPLLEEIDTPALVVVGEYDLPGMAQLSAQLSERLPRGSLITIPRSAHCPSLDQPAALNQIVLDFVNSIV